MGDKIPSLFSLYVIYLQLAHTWIELKGTFAWLRGNTSNIYFDMSHGQIQRFSPLCRYWGAQWNWNNFFSSSIANMPVQQHKLILAQTFLFQFAKRVAIFSSKDVSNHGQVTNVLILVLTKVWRWNIRISFFFHMTCSICAETRTDFVQWPAALTKTKT